MDTTVGLVNEQLFHLKGLKTLFFSIVSDVPFEGKKYIFPKKLKKRN